MEIQKLEMMRNQAVQEVIMREKMVEQAKAQVANIEGRIAERKEIEAEAGKPKKEAKNDPLDEIFVKKHKKPQTKK